MRHQILRFLNILPVFLLNLILSGVKFFKYDLYVKIIRKMTPNKLLALTKLSPKAIAKLPIMTSKELSKYLLIELVPEKYEQVKTPDIYQITVDNFVNLRQDPINIYLFENVRFRPKSDIIQFDDKVFWQKFNRAEFSQMIPMDADFISVDYKSRQVFVINNDTRHSRHYQSAFSLCGVHTEAWGHFLLSYLPKLQALQNISETETNTIIIPKNMHAHHRDMIELFLEANFLERKLVIEEVDDHETIICDKLYYCNSIGFLSDSGLLVSPASSSISKYGSEAISNFMKHVHGKTPSTPTTKIYIGRGAGRNNTNAAEIEEFFVSNGFEVVYPHLLTIAQKMEIFGNATHICGPVSSGFTNMIFCKKNVKILGFFNYARAFDPFISGLNHAGGLGHEILFITGYEEPTPYINNSYYIDLERVKHACSDISFFKF